MLLSLCMTNSFAKLEKKMLITLQFEENQPAICSSGFPFKVSARRILDSFCMDWDSDFLCFAHKEHSCDHFARMLFVCETREIRIPIHA